MSSFLFLNNIVSHLFFFKNILPKPQMVALRPIKHKLHSEIYVKQDSLLLKNLINPILLLFDKIQKYLSFCNLPKKKILLLYFSKSVFLVYDSF